jgi:hypothetical protein
MKTGVFAVAFAIGVFGTGSPEAPHEWMTEFLAKEEMSLLQRLHDFDAVATLFVQKKNRVEEDDSGNLKELTQERIKEVEEQLPRMELVAQLTGALVMYLSGKMPSEEYDVLVTNLDDIIAHLKIKRDHAGLDDKKMIDYELTRAEKFRELVVAHQSSVIKTETEKKLTEADVVQKQQDLDAAKNTDDPAKIAKAKEALNVAQKTRDELKGSNIHCWLWPTLAAVLLVGTLVAFFALREAEEEEDDDDDCDDSDSSEEDDEAGKP